ncbi:hypothetical protein H4R99_005003 [Coemansia sp. RSA 1722]|nr:hypothetical protein LPJ57_004725 [Coemansia sp. RSA 486]KAJ2596244.1 hypothetical protein H4R99_005003 [Coemansia sp. RSA 1722]
MLGRTAVSRGLLQSKALGYVATPIRCRLFSNSKIIRTTSTKEDPTPLTKHIRDTILATGPISIAKYMQLALTSPVGGYYTRGQVFGRSGDFVTSPEISQMFGEIMAVWYVLHWEMLGRPQKTAFVELGPGRGTLMADMLRASKRFPDFIKSIRSVHFVEKSPELRKLQHEKLGCAPESTKNVQDKSDQGTPAMATASIGAGNIDVHWYGLLEEIKLESDCVPLVMAHEFFDALPIYKFEKGAGDLWSEILVDVAESSTKAADASSKVGTAANTSEQNKQNSDFKYVRSRNVTANAALLLRDQKFSSMFDKGDHIEVSPESAHIMTQLAEWISANKGMGLVVDYGQDWTQGDTFRGIKNHKFDNPLSSPGSMDLTADVDFSYLRYAAKDKASCFGPVEQGFFLHSMGIQARLQQLLNTTRDSSVQKNLVDCYRRLTDPNSMGRIYKVLAVLPKDSSAVPIPFTPPTTEELNKPKIERIVK